MKYKKNIYFCEIRNIKAYFKKKTCDIYIIGVVFM